MKSSRVQYKVILGASLVVATILLSSVPFGAIAQDKPCNSKPAKKLTRVIVDHVKRETMRQTVPIIGRFLARQTGPVTARIPGVIHEFRARVGDRVEKGDVIALVGESGNSKGPHLHFEIWKNNIVLDPREIIPIYKKRDVSIR